MSSTSSDPRRQGKLRWNASKQRRFLECLAEHCNVARAAREIGYSYAGVYLRRRNNPDFAALWEEAYAAGYDRLEAAVLARGLVMASGGGVEDELAAQPMTIADALSILKRQQGRVARAHTRNAPPAPDADAARAALIKLVLAVKRARERREAKGE